MYANDFSVRITALGRDIWDLDVNTIQKALMVYTPKTMDLEMSTNIGSYSSSTKYSTSPSWVSAA